MMFTDYAVRRLECVCGWHRVKYSQKCYLENLKYEINTRKELKQLVSTLRKQSF